MNDKISKEIRGVIDSIKSYIRLEKEFGVTECCLSAPQKSEMVKKPSPASFGKWEELEHEILTCTNCSLSQTRKNAVVGSGNRSAKLLFVGEAPGQEEDLKGKPFVGRAGALLTKIIEAMGLTRDKVYIANILKCRPPHNRSPLPTEILACQHNIERQIALIRPKIICTLGKFASQTLLKSIVPISKLRGVFSDYQGIKVMPTYHPAYLLRNPSEKHAVWQDMKKIMKELKR